MPQSHGGVNGLRELSRIPLFASLKKKQLTALAYAATYTRIAPGELIYRQDNTVPYIAAIISGTVQRERLTGEMHSVIATLVAPDVWGFSALLQPNTRLHYSARAGALGAVLLTWKVLDLIKLCQRDAELRQSLMQSSILQLQRDITRLESTLGFVLGLQPIVDAAEIRTHDKYSQILSALLRQCGFQSGLIAKLDPAQRHITIEASLGFARVPAGQSLPLASDTILSQVFATGRHLVLSPESFERKFSLAPYYAEHLAVIPLALTTDSEGALLIADAARPVTTEMIWLMQLVSMGIRLIASHDHHETLATYAEYVKRAYIGSL